MNQDNFLAYVKYEGKLVEDGYMDARRSAEVLIGIDEIFRFFLLQIDKDLQGQEFEIPVRIRKGSWEALIPHDIQSWLITAGGVGLTSYMKKAMEKLAENDFKDMSSKDIIKKVVKSVKWVVKISKHINSLVVKKFQDVDFQHQENGTLIGIKNSVGEILYVPLEYLELYKSCPEKLFEKLTKSVEEERELSIGFNENEPVDADDVPGPVKIGIRDKSIFVKSNDDSELLFPELVHNQPVELIGHVSRGNENSNTIGFEYKNHILTCMPATGNISDYKDRLFTNCIMKGNVERLSESGEIIEKRPRIRFYELTTIIDSPDLFTSPTANSTYPKGGLSSSNEH